MYTSHKFITIVVSLSSVGVYLVRLAVHLLKSEIRATPSICAVGRDPRAQETKNIT